MIKQGQGNFTRVNYYHSSRLPCADFLFLLQVPDAERQHVLVYEYIARVLLRHYLSIHLRFSVFALANDNGMNLEPFLLCPPPPPDPPVPPRFDTLVVDAIAARNYKFVCTFN